MTLARPASCPACSADTNKIVWNGGSPPSGPDHWLCDVCGHKWSTSPVSRLDPSTNG